MGTKSAQDNISQLNRWREYRGLVSLSLSERLAGNAHAATYFGILKLMESQMFGHAEGELVDRCLAIYEIVNVTGDAEQVSRCTPKGRTTRKDGQGPLQG